MARSHHRKKHKEHVRQFRHSHEVTGTTPAGSKALYVTLIIGALTGFIVGYFASGGTLLWMTVGLITGALAGWFTGKKLDENN